jgi:hypothetical protein
MLPFKYIQLNIHETRCTPFRPVPAIHVISVHLTFRLRFIIQIGILLISLIFTDDVSISLNIVCYWIRLTPLSTIVDVGLKDWLNWIGITRRNPTYLPYTTDKLYHKMLVRNGCKANYRTLEVKQFTNSFWRSFNNRM